jgi:serine/threonine protein phosphatase PrpC
MKKQFLSFCVIRISIAISLTWTFRSFLFHLWHYFIFYMFFTLQISRSIGDVYLKKAEFNREPLYAKFRLREPFKKPILSSEPSISVHQLQPQDQFIIFASDGLWEQLSNQEVVDIVQNNPHSVRY